MFRWNSFCYGNTSQLIYHLSLKYSWKKNYASWDFPFLPSFLPSFPSFLPSFLPSGAHTTSTISSRADTKMQRSFLSYPKPRMVLIRKPMLYDRGILETFFFFARSWSITFFLCIYINICIWHSDKHCFLERIIHVLLASCGSGWVSGLSLWAIKNQSFQKVIYHKVVWTTLWTFPSSLMTAEEVLIQLMPDP